MEGIINLIFKFNSNRDAVIQVAPCLLAVYIGGRDRAWQIYSLSGVCLQNQNYYANEVFIGINLTKLIKHRNISLILRF